MSLRTTREGDMGRCRKKKENESRRETKK